MYVHEQKYEYEILKTKTQILNEKNKANSSSGDNALHNWYRLYKTEARAKIKINSFFNAKTITQDGNKYSNVLL